MFFLSFLIFFATIVIHVPVESQEQLIIPDDSLVMQGRLLRGAISGDAYQFRLETDISSSIYLLNTETQVLSGSSVKVNIPDMNFTDILTEDTTGSYSSNISEMIIATPQVDGLTPDQINRLKIRPISSSVNLNGNSLVNTSGNIGELEVSSIEVDFGSDIDVSLLSTPVINYISNAGIASITTIKRYNISFNFSLSAYVLDEFSNPLANSEISVKIDLPNHAHTETIATTTDSEGKMALSITKGGYIEVTSGSLTDLAQPVSIQGTSTLVVPFWYHNPPPPPPKNPPEKDVNDGGNTKDPDGSAGNDPINVTTGNMYSIYKDIFIPGKGIPLEFRRVYNSQKKYDGHLGFGWTHNYNIFLKKKTSGDIIKNDRDGSESTYILNPDGSYSSPSGDHSMLFKNTDNTFTLTTKHGVRYDFDTGGRLISITDTNGNQTTLAYTGANLISVTDSSGRELSFSYNGNGKITQIRDPLGRAHVYQYDSNNNLVKHTNPQGNETSYSYDNFDNTHELVRITDANGNVSNITYDNDGNADSFSYQGNNHLIRLSYDESNNKTTVTDSRGNDTIYYYTEINNIRLITRIVYPDGSETTSTWDSDMNKTSYTDQNGNTTYMTYDTNGNLLTMTDPMNSITTFTYEPDYNKVLSLTDPLANVTKYSYDANGNLLSVVDPAGNTTDYQYNSSGLLIQMTDARGNSTSYDYDEYGNLTAMTDPLSNQTIFTYDLVGNTTAITDANNTATRFEYDDMNRLIRILYPDGTDISYGYDAVGNRTSITDQKGAITRYRYDVANRLDRVTDPLGNETYYSYDTEGNRVRITDASRNSTVYTYNSLNRLTTTTDPIGNRATYSYDQAGNRTGLTDANGNTTTYSYDDNNRLIRISYSDGAQIEFIYDAIGRRISMIDSRGETTYTYDNLNRLISVDGHEANDTISYAYDAVGNRTSMTNQDNGLTTYEYDALNRLISLTNPRGEVTTYTYDNVSNITQMNYPNGMNTEYIFNNLNRLVSLVNKKDTGDVISSYGYEYDQVGMRTRETRVNGDYVEYGYDRLNRLISEQAHITDPNTGDIDYNTIQYTFDKVGNRLTMTKFLAPGLAQTDVTSDVQVNKYAVRYSRRTGILSAAINITNRSGESFGNPVGIVIKDISNPAVTVNNPDGYTAGGDAYFNYSYLLGGDDKLDIGETSSARRIKFNNPRRYRFNYNIEVLAVRGDTTGTGRILYRYYYDEDNRLTKIEETRLGGSSGGSSGGSGVPVGGGSIESTPGEILVKFTPGTAQQDIDMINARYGTSDLEIIPKIGVHRLRLPEGVTKDGMINSEHSVNGVV